MTNKIVLAMVDETGVRVTGRYRDWLQQHAKTETFPEARAAVWADYSQSRRDHIVRHIEAEKLNHLWVGYFVLPDTKDILAIARDKALKAAAA